MNKHWPTLYERILYNLTYRQIEGNIKFVNTLCIKKITNLKETF